MQVSSRADSSWSQASPGRFDRTEGVLGTRQGDTTVLLDVNGGMYYTLNEVGGRVWDLLGEGLTMRAIVERLVEEYDVPLDRLDADVRALLDRLRAAKLVEPSRQ
jgi:hypothetical protein